MILDFNFFTIRPHDNMKGNSKSNDIIITVQ